MMGRKNSKRLRAERRRERRDRFESRLNVEKVGPIMPDDQGSLQDNPQHLMIMKAMDQRWERLTGKRKRRETVMV